MLVLFIYKNILFGWMFFYTILHTTQANTYVLNQFCRFYIIVNMSTRRYSDDEIDRVFAILKMGWKQL